MILNFFDLKSFYYNFFWNRYFMLWEYSKSKVYFEKVKGETWKYNLANSHYKSWSYKDSLSNYKLDCTDWINCFKINNNLWNTYFRIWEKSSNFEEIENLLNKSIDYYREALSINYDKETEKNLEYVLDYLKKLKEAQKKKEDKDNEAKNDKSKQEKSSQDDKSDKSDQEKNNSWESWEEDNSSHWQKNQNNNEQNGEKKWLSDTEKKAMQEYEEALKQSQESFWKYYWKVYEESPNPIDEFETFFWNDRFFDNSRLEGGNEKKDW